MLVSRQRESHWYQYVPETNSILPVWEVPYADREGMRPTTLRDARKMNLMVGISSIANMLPKWNLQAWKIEQGILAALTLPRQEGEELDAYAHRVVQDMEEKSMKARECGTRIHNAIRDYFNGLGQRTPEDLRIHLAPLYDWCAKNIEEVRGTEMDVGDPALGIGGRLDVDCRIRAIGDSIIDFKTSQIKDGKANFWDEFLIQLCGYEHCRRREDGIVRELVSIVINSTAPDQPHVKHWLGARELGWKVFQHCLEIWKFTNSYDPSNH